ncbi:hypothetical protein ES705_37556 [subsurface metagenome]
MAKEQCNYPVSLDTLIVDRVSGQVVPSVAFDIIEDAITEIEKELRRVTTKTGAGTLAATEGGLIVCTSSADYTLGLPPASNTGLLYFIVKTDNNYYRITLDANESETIGGLLTYTDLDYQLAYVAIKSDGTNWQVIARSRLVAQSIHFQDLRAADDDYVHDAIIGGAEEEQEVTTEITNPDVPRNVSVKTTNVSSPEGIVKITGIDSKGESAEDDITVILDGTAYGVVAFATISMITVPAGVHGEDTVTIGISDKLGLGSSIIKVTDVFKKKVNNEDKSIEISGNVDVTYDTLNCATIVENEETTIWFLGRV